MAKAPFEYLDAYITLLKKQGYSAASTQTQIRLITRFNQWLQRKHVELYDLVETVIERFLKSHQNASGTRRGNTAALRRLLHLLRQLGATRQVKKTPLCPQRRLTMKYGRYLIEACGLSQATVGNYAPLIDRFLSERFRNVPFNLSQLCASDLTGFVQRHAQKLGVKRSQLLVSALRSFLRYLRHQGKVRTDLAACVPTVARWSFASLPKFLPAGAIQRVLDHVDQQTAVGRRNHAILLLLARLGLRSAEIVALNLEDIDWESARITIRSRGGRLSQLPLPADVGRAGFGNMSHEWTTKFIEHRLADRRILRLIQRRRLWGASALLATSAVLWHSFVATMPGGSPGIGLRSRAASMEMARTASSSRNYSQISTVNRSLRDTHRDTQ